MDPITIAALGAQALTGLVQGVTGILQKGKAKRMAASNKRPFYNIPQTELENKRIADRNAARGLSDEARNLYTQSSDRQLTAGIDAITTGGGTVDNIAELYTAANSGVSKMALLDDQMRVENMRRLTEENNRYSDSMDKQWQVNQWGPYADKAQAAAALSKQGTDNTWKGVNTIGESVANYATAKSDYPNPYGSRGGGSAGTAGTETVQTTPPTGGQLAPYSGISLNADTQAASARVLARYGGLQMGYGNHTPIFNSDGEAIDPATGKKL